MCVALPYCTPPHNPLSPSFGALGGINTCVHMCFSIVPPQGLRGGKGVKRGELRGVRKLKMWNTQEQSETKNAGLDKYNIFIFFIVLYVCIDIYTHTKRAKLDKKKKKKKYPGAPPPLPAKRRLAVWLKKIRMQKSFANIIKMR